MSRMTVGAKIGVMCGLMAVFTLVVGGLGLYSVQSLSGSMDRLSKKALPGAYLAGRLNTGAKAVLIRINLHMQTDSAEKMQKFEKYLNDRAVAWRKEADDFEAVARGAKEREMIASSRADFEQLLQVWARILPLSREHKSNEAFAIYEAEATGPADRLDETMKALVASSKKDGDEIAKEAAASVNSARWMVGLALLFCMAAGAVVAYVLIRGINAALRNAIDELTTSSNQVSSASTQIADTSQGLARGASEQAASLEETSASGEEVNSMAQRNAENSSSAVGLVLQSQQRFGEADRALREMTQAMEAINESSGKIGRIIKVIDEIAFQTNILALNAAVEAARAGEAGMGFAVVADEVRSLAQRSAQAARDTTSLIEESIASARSGKAKVSLVTTSMSSVTGLSEQIKVLVEEVSTSSQQQAKGIHEISQAMARMEQVTQRNAANAEESASAAEELSAQSATMDHIVLALAEMIERR